MIAVERLHFECCLSSEEVAVTAAENETKVFVCLPIHVVLL